MQVTYSSAPSSVQFQPRHRRRSTTKRNPARKGSKWRYYAVNNGLEGDDVYSSWHQAYSYCWDPERQYFFQGSFCKGFDDYDRASDFLLGVVSQPSQNQEPNIPPEPPKLDIPSEPTLTPGVFSHPNGIHQTSTLMIL